MLRFLNRKKYDHVSFLVSQMMELQNEIVWLNVDFHDKKISQEEYHKLSKAKTKLLLKRKRQHRYANML